MGELNIVSDDVILVNESRWRQGMGMLSTLPAPFDVYPLVTRGFPSPKLIMPWWRHQMETLPVSLALCAEKSQSRVNSPHKGQYRAALPFSLICVWTNGWVSNRNAGDLKLHRPSYDVTVMQSFDVSLSPEQVGLPVIWYPIRLMWHRCNDIKCFLVARNFLATTYGVVDFSQQYHAG